MKGNIFTCMLLLTAAISITCSCKKGDKGDPGTANVYYSDWFTPSPYTKDTIFGIYGFKYNKAAPSITQQMLDTAAILTFGKLLGYNPAVWPTTQVAQLPISLTYKQSGQTMTDTWSALATPGNLRIWFVNDKNDYNVIATQHQFRYIIIPAGSRITGRLAQRTYEEICKEYNIPE